MPYPLARTVLSRRSSRTYGIFARSKQWLNVRPAYEPPTMMTLKSFALELALDILAMVGE